MSDEPKPATGEQVKSSIHDKNGVCIGFTTQPATGDWTVAVTDEITVHENLLLSLKAYFDLLAAERERGYQEAASGNEAIEQQLRAQLAALVDALEKIAKMLPYPEPRAIADAALAKVRK